MELRFCIYNPLSLLGPKGSKLIIRPPTQHLKNWLDLCHDSGQDVVFLVKIDARVQDL